MGNNVDPNYAKAYYNRGVNYYKLGDKEKAIHNFQRAANLFQQQGNTQLSQEALDAIRKLQ